MTEVTTGVPKKGPETVQLFSFRQDAWSRFQFSISLVVWRNFIDPALFNCLNIDFGGRKEIDCDSTRTKAIEMIIFTARSMSQIKMGTSTQLSCIVDVN